MMILSKIYIFLVRAYQVVLSPDYGLFRGVFGFSRCRFRPSCSVYSVEAVRQYGLLTGGVLSIKRIIRCNPFCEGGYDPVGEIPNSKLQIPNKSQ